MTKLNKIREECICGNYDGQGVSTCGFPCPVHKPINKEWEEEIREICTYYGDEGTNGYSLSNGQFERVFEVISTLLKQQKQEIKEKFIELAIDGDIDDEMKGLLLYIRFLEYLKYEK